MLLRVLFPSWRFFEDLCYLPELYYRLSSDGITFSPWQPALNKINRNFLNIALNPTGNALLAYHTLLQQLEDDKEALTEENKNSLIDSVSYQLVKNLVVTEIINQNPLAVGNKFQFKLSARMQGVSQLSEDTLISITHEVSCLSK